MFHLEVHNLGVLTVQFAKIVLGFHSLVNSILIDHFEIHHNSEQDEENHEEKVDLDKSFAKTIIELIE